MEECSICFSVFSKDNKKTLACNHHLCNKCYLRLDNANCPFCRTEIIYTREDYIKRERLTSTYYRWQPPTQLFSLESFTDLNLNSSSFEENQENVVSNVRNSRLRKNQVRKRRRNLTFEEVQERRRIIKKKCKQKWERKDGRLIKTKWYN